MDEATLIKFGKWIDYGKFHPRSKNFPSKWAWSASWLFFKILNPHKNISGMDEATLIKFGKCIDYDKSYSRG